jgi:hypothetical protein
MMSRRARSFNKNSFKSVIIHRTPGMFEARLIQVPFLLDFVFPV